MTSPFGLSQGYGTTFGPDTMGGLLADFDYGAELTPEQQFRQFAMQAGPLGPQRSALYGMSQPLMAQWQLQQPRSIGGVGGSFADYLKGRAMGGGLGQIGTPQIQDQRSLAEIVNVLGGLSQAEYAGLYSDPGSWNLPASSTMGTDTLAGLRDLTDPQLQQYRQTYGTGEGAAQNRLRLAQLLALTGGGTGTATPAGGAYGRAISGAIQELYNQMTAQDPQMDFLNWYLGRHQPASPQTLTAAPTGAGNGNGAANDGMNTLNFTTQ